MQLILRSKDPTTSSSFKLWRGWWQQKGGWVTSNYLATNKHYCYRKYCRCSGYDTWKLYVTLPVLYSPSSCKNSGPRERKGTKTIQCCHTDLHSSNLHLQSLGRKFPWNQWALLYFHVILLLIVRKLWFQVSHWNQWDINKFDCFIRIYAALFLAPRWVLHEFAQ